MAAQGELRGAGRAHVRARSQGGAGEGRYQAALSFSSRGLDLSHLTRRFGEVTALDDVSLSVAPGEVLGLLGPNGAGKTTLMRAVMGVTGLDGGVAGWDGHAITEADRRTFGYMPEERGLYPKMRLQDQLVYFARLHGLARRPATTA